MSAAMPDPTAYAVTLTHAGQVSVIGPFTDYEHAWTWLAGRPAQAYGATTLAIAPLRAPQTT